MPDGPASLCARNEDPLRGDGIPLLTSSSCVGAFRKEHRVAPPLWAVAQSRFRPGTARCGFGDYSSGVISKTSQHLIALLGREAVEPAGASGVDKRLAVHPWLMCAAFHDVFPPPDRSVWPSMARARSAGTSAGAFAARGRDI